MGKHQGTNDSNNYGRYKAKKQRLAQGTLCWLASATLLHTFYYLVGLD